MKDFEKKSNDIKDNDFLTIYKKISEHSPNGIVVADKNFNIVFLNSAVENVTGVLVVDAINNNFHNIFPQLSELIKGNLNKNISYVTMNGKNIIVKMFSIINEYDMEFMVLILQDISEEIKLSMELNESHHIIKELEDILEGSFDGVLVTDGVGKVLLVNNSYERITGITKEEMIGKNMKELINPIWMKNSVVFPVIEAKKPISLHHTTRYDKNIIVTGMPVLDKNGEINKIVVNARDITEIYDLREELQRAREMEELYFNSMSESGYKVSNHDDIVFASETMNELFLLAHKVSSFDTTVLILGESGVGKDVVAKYLHANSLRKNKDFIAVNCGAIPEQLLESELFGYEKGAFTGALKEGKKGLFEAAEGGIIFLDEIGEMSPNLQIKLLRVLETREINRVGSLKPISVDVRVMAATNKDLKSLVETGGFREDLFYRINVIQIEIPPLRERIKDIAPLSLHFLQMFNCKYGQSKKLTYDVIKEFESYNWPGNIRQLKNTVENMVVVSNNEFLQINDLPWHSNSKIEIKSVQNIIETDIMPLAQAVKMVEKQVLIKAKEKYKTTRKIAEAIGVDQSTVVRKLKRYGLSLIKEDE